MSLRLVSSQSAPLSSPTSSRSQRRSIGWSQLLLKVPITDLSVKMLLQIALLLSHKPSRAESLAQVLDELVKDIDDETSHRSHAIHNAHPTLSEVRPVDRQRPAAMRLPSSDGDSVS